MMKLDLIANLFGMFVMAVAVVVIMHDIATVVAQ